MGRGAGCWLLAAGPLRLRPRAASRALCVGRGVVTRHGLTPTRFHRQLMRLLDTSKNPKPNILKVRAAG